jgi:predicted nucleic acid-binding protein
MELRVYLDTSVFSAHSDERAPERMQETREFWSRLGDYEVSTSDLARDEIEQTADSDRREQILGLLRAAQVHGVTDEMHDLARSYVERGLVSPAMYNDALHVAAAVLTRQDILVSWNFRHLVNRRKRAQANEVNVSFGLPTIEILAPSEL